MKNFNDEALQMMKDLDVYWGGQALIDAFSAKLRQAYEKGVSDTLKELYKENQFKVL